MEPGFRAETKDFQFVFVHDKEKWQKHLHLINYMT